MREDYCRSYSNQHQQLEEQVLVVLSTIKSLAIQIFEVIRNGSKIITIIILLTTKADGHLLEYFRQTFGAGGGGTNTTTKSPQMGATGGVISDYTSRTRNQL